jgi:hypothetical protein
MFLERNYNDSDMTGRHVDAMSVALLRGFVLTLDVTKPAYKYFSLPGLSAFVKRFMYIKKHIFCLTFA